MMTRAIPSLTFSGGQVLTDGQLSPCDVATTDGVIALDGPPSGPVVDVTGYYVLPGIVDLHGDAFERHIAPRPTAPFSIEMGLEGTDRDAAAHGVTTAWMAQSWSWEGGYRGADFAERFLATH